MAHNTCLFAAMAHKYSHKTLYVVDRSETAISSFQSLAKTHRQSRSTDQLAPTRST